MFLSSSPDLENKVVDKIFDPIIERTRELSLRKSKNEGKNSGEKVMFPDLQVCIYSV